MFSNLMVLAEDAVFFRNTALGCMAAACAVTDLCCGKVFNLVTVPGLFFGILLCAGSCGAEGILNIMCCVAFTIVFLYPFFRAGGLGAGDIKLLAAVSAFLEPEEYLLCFGCAFVLGAGIGLLRLLRSGGRMHTVHFAVPVAASVLLHLAGVY